MLRTGHVERDPVNADIEPSADNGTVNVFDMFGVLYFIGGTNTCNCHLGLPWTEAERSCPAGSCRLPPSLARRADQLDPSLANISSVLRLHKNVSYCEYDGSSGSSRDPSCRFVRMHNPDPASGKF